MNNHNFHGRIISKKIMGEGDFQRLIFTVAVQNKFKDKSGNKRDDNMHPCVAFGKLAGMIDKYFDVGHGIIISNAEFTSSSKKTEESFTTYYNFVMKEVDFPVQNKAKDEPVKADKIDKPLPDEIIHDDDDDEIPF